MGWVVDICLGLVLRGLRLFVSFYTTLALAHQPKTVLSDLPPYAQPAAILLQCRTHRHLLFYRLHHTGIPDTPSHATPRVNHSLGCQFLMCFIALQTFLGYPSTPELLEGATMPRHAIRPRAKVCVRKTTRQHQLRRSLTVTAPPVNPFSTH